MSRQSDDILRVSAQAVSNLAGRDDLTAEERDNLADAIASGTAEMCVRVLEGTASEEQKTALDAFIQSLSS